MRLIDADAINCNEECQNCQFARWYDFEGICALNEQPTAYDVDKVCEDIKNKSMMFVDPWVSYEFQRWAIDIVKRGGIDD